MRGSPEHSVIVRHGSDGRVRVSVHEQGARVILQVQDSGPGIPADQFERIFDRFYRLDGDQHASGVVGCGLGLSIVRHVAELHHASITLGKSEFASGLSVSVSFPARCADAQVKPAGQQRVVHT